MNTPHKTPPKFLENLHHGLKETVNKKTQAQGSPFSSLPNHLTTPPNRFMKIKNPFEDAMNEKLHLQIFSPNVFTETQPKNPEKFKWTIDDVSNLKPANIDVSTVAQFEHHEEDMTVQAKIEKYFSEAYIVPSPWNAQNASQPLISEENLKIENKKNIRDESTQTVLSLPVNLPESLEKALMPYFTYNEEKEKQSLDMNSSFCRKLFYFEHPEESVSFASSILSNLSEFCSPHMPAGKIGKNKRTFDSSEPELSPVELSPIHISTPTINERDMSTIENRSPDVRLRCDQRERENISPIPFEFTGHMSVDSSFNIVPESICIEPHRGNNIDWNIEHNSVLSNQSIRRNLFEVSSESMDISIMSRPISPITDQNTSPKHDLKNTEMQ